jgi:hypothetical protein
LHGLFLPQHDMTRKTKLAILVIALFGLIDVVWGYLRAESIRFGNKPHRVFVSGTVEESKSRGAFIGRLDITPSNIPWRGKQIDISQAWLEHATELVHVYVVIPFLMEYPHYRTVNGYHLCFNCADRDGLRTDPTPLFVVEGKGHSMTVFWPNDPREKVHFCEDFDDLGQMPKRIELANNWEREGRILLEVKRATD